MRSSSGCVWGWGGGLNVCTLILCGQKLDDEDALVIAQNINKFERLQGLNLVRCGRAASLACDSYTAVG